MESGNEFGLHIDSCFVVGSEVELAVSCRSTRPRPTSCRSPQITHTSQPNHTATSSKAYYNNQEECLSGSGPQGSKSLDNRSTSQQQVALGEGEAEGT
jgi:hypothetical protein